MTKVYEFGDGKVCEHLGGIYDFLAAKNAQNINEAVAATAAKSVAKDAPKQQSDNRLNYEAEKQLMKQRRKVEHRVEENERAVNELESAIAAIEALMSTPEGGADAKNYERYASLKKQLNEAMNEWEASMEELDNLETNR